MEIFTLVLRACPIRNRGVLGRCSATVELVNIFTTPLFLLSGYYVAVEPFILFLPWIHLLLRM